MASVVVAFAAVVVVLLTYSRGGVVVALLAPAAYIALTRKRVEAAAALVVALVPAALLCLWAFQQPGLVEDGQPYDERLREGLWFAIGLLLAGAVVAGVAYLGVTHEDRWRSRVSVRFSRRQLAALVAVPVALVVLLFLVADPIDRARDSYREFTNPVTSAGSGPARLRDFGSNSRWTWWGEAWQLWEDNPVVGTGAGTFSLARRPLRTNTTVATEPHNLALQFLSETGLVGFLLAAGVGVAAAFGIVRALRRLDEPEAAAGLALAVVALAYLAHAVIDYDWDFVGVSAPLFLVLGVLVAAGRPALEAVREPFFAAGAVVLGLAVLGSLASPWLASRSVADAYAALERRDPDEAVDRAGRARSLNPLAVEPIFAEAVAEEARGNDGEALELYIRAVELQPEELAYMVRARALRARRGAARGGDPAPASLAGARPLGAVGHGARQARHLSARREAAFAAAAAVLACVGATIFLRLWDADLRVPFSYSGDGTLNLTLIKTVMERGWFYENPRLGAPSGQELYDYPVLSGDGLHVAFFWLAGLFTDDPSARDERLLRPHLPGDRRRDVPRAAAACGRARGRGLVIAVLYTLTPYHFMRGEVHLFLAAYYVVPIGAYLALSVLDGRASDRAGDWRGWRRSWLSRPARSTTRRSRSCSSPSRRVLRFFASRDRRAFLPAGFVVGVILAVSLVQLAPTIVYRVANGTNEEVAKRYWFESENYSLRLTQLLLPVDGHRIDALASRKAEYTEQIPQNEGRAATLGIVASVGFLWLLAVVLLAVVGAWPGVIARYRGIAALTLAAVLVGDDGRAGDAAGRRVAADPGLEPAVDLHRVLRAAGGGAPARVAPASATCSRRLGRSSPGCSCSARWIRRRPSSSRRMPGSRPTTEPTSRGIARWRGSWRRARRSCSCPTSPSPSRRSGRGRSTSRRRGICTRRISAGAGARCAAGRTTGLRCMRRGPPRSSSRQRARRASRRSWSTSSRTRTVASRPSPTSAECSARNRSAARRAAISSGASEAK